MVGEDPCHGTFWASLSADEGGDGGGSVGMHAG
jgi:hypothetical protein